MFFVVMAAALVVAPAASPAPAATPAPLREIVYRYNYDSKVERSVQQFGAPDLNVGNTNAFAGKLTVDVTQATSDGSIRVTATSVPENTINIKHPVVADIVIYPDSGYKLIGGETEEMMLTLIPYLATSYYGGHELQEGATWKVISAPTDPVQTTTTFTVSNVTTDTATITSDGHAKGGGVNGTLTIETKVVYKASLLVPLSVDVIILRAANGTTAGNASNIDVQTHYHFDRASDTRDTGSSGR